MRPTRPFVVYILLEYKLSFIRRGDVDVNFDVGVRFNVDFSFDVDVQDPGKRAEGDTTDFHNHFTPSKILVVKL